MNYRGMISDADLMKIMLNLSSNTKFGNKSIDRRINDFWATFEVALEERLTAAVESAAELKRQEQYNARVRVAEQVVLKSVAQDVGGYLSEMRTKASVEYFSKVEQTEAGILITVEAKGAFGSAGRTIATGKDGRFLERKVNEGAISFDHTPSLEIERYNATIQMTPIPSFQITYRTLVPTGMLGTIYSANPK